MMPTSFIAQKPGEPALLNGMDNMPNIAQPLNPNEFEEMTIYSKSQAKPRSHQHSNRIKQ